MTTSLAIREIGRRFRKDLWNIGDLTLADDLIRDRFQEKRPARDSCPAGAALRQDVTNVLEFPILNWRLRCQQR